VASDGRVFFLQLSASAALLPQLSCQLPGSSSSCSCWSPDGRCLLVGFSSGVAVELAVPDLGSKDNSRWVRQHLGMGLSMGLNPKP
jgi:hypothetical protein